MKIIKTHILIISIITLSLILPFFLYFIALFIAFFIEEASALKPYISGTIVLIASWPSLLLKIFPTTTTMNGTVEYEAGYAIFNPLVIIVNAIGWAIVGLIVGIIISVIKFKKQVKE